MMRRWRVLGVALAVLSLVVAGLGVWWSSRGSAEAPPWEAEVRARASAPRGSSALPGTLQALFSSPSEERGLHIRGTVLGAQGPLAGATVLASLAVAGETLSELPCEDNARRSLLECDTEAQVEALVEERRGEALVVARATSAADGTFTLQCLEPGRYALWGEAPGGVGLRFDVAAGTEGVELRLGTGVRVSGSVTDERGASVPGALVTAFLTAHSRFFETLTDDQGRYQLGPLPRGDYRLVVARAGLLTHSQQFTGYAAEVKLPIKLLRPRSLSGLVLRAGTPVAGVEVRLQRWYKYSGYSDEALRTPTDAAGRFTFEGLTPSRVKLIAEHGGDAAVQSLNLEEPEEPEEPVKEAEGSAELILELGPAAYVWGVVRDDLQRPIDKAGVSMAHVDEDYRSQSAQTDTDGRYRIGPLRPGTWSFSIAADGYEKLEPAQELTAGEHRLDFTLARAVLIEGLLVDAEGKPIPGERLALFSGESQDPKKLVTLRRSTQEGRFALTVPAPGTYRLLTSLEKPRPLELLVTAPARGLRLVSRQGPMVRGELVDELGVPLPGVEVALFSLADSEGKGALDRTFSDMRGHFSLSSPSEGPHVVAAELARQDFVRTASQKVELVGEEPAQVRLRFDEGRSLSGVAVDLRGHPLSDVYVVARAAPRAAMRTRCTGPRHGVTSGPDGRFTFQLLSGEQFDLTSSKEGYTLVEPQGGSLRVGPDTQEVRLVFKREAFIRGHLAREDGSPIPSFVINGKEREDESGEFSWPITRTGTQQLELSAPGLPPLRLSVAVQDEVDTNLGTLVPGRR